VVSLPSLEKMLRFSKKLTPP
jgi:hypothetical protein